MIQRGIFIDKIDKNQKDGNLSFLKYDHQQNEPSFISVNHGEYGRGQSLDNSALSLNTNNSKSKFYKKKNKQSPFSGLDIAILIIGFVLLIWLIIDFTLIGVRFFNDRNGVGLIYYPNYGNIY